MFSENRNVYYSVETKCGRDRRQMSTVLRKHIHFACRIKTRPRIHIHTHAHTHAHTRAHARAHTRTRTQAHARTYTHTCAHTRARAHTHEHTHVHARTHTRSLLIFNNYFWSMATRVTRTCQSSRVYASCFSR
jgi:hypothetical protein